MKVESNRVAKFLAEEFGAPCCIKPIMFTCGIRKGENGVCQCTHKECWNWLIKKYCSEDKK